MISSYGARFALSDPHAKRVSWIQVGDSFADYTLEKFEREQERIILRRGEETIELSLKTAAVGPVKGVPVNAATSVGAAEKSGRPRTLSDRPRARAAKDSFNSGNLREAERLAREILAGERQADDTGGPLHDAHMVLGRIALKEGRVAEAIDSLLAAARDNGGDPGMNSFGPNMSLAKDLLEHGEQKSVLQYFELCRQFWKHGHTRLDEWTAEIKAGTIPKFGPNLVY